MEARWRPDKRRMDVILKKSIKIESDIDELKVMRVSAE